MTEFPIRPRVSSGALSFELDCAQGTFNLIAPDGNPIATNLECSAILDGQSLHSAGTQTIWRTLPDPNTGLEAEFALSSSFAIVLRVKADTLNAGLLLTLTAANHGGNQRIEELRVLSTGSCGQLDFCPKTSDLLFFRNGSNAAEPTITVWMGDPNNPCEEQESAQVTGMVNRKSGKGIVAGFLAAGKQFSRLRSVSRSGSSSLEAVALTEGTVVNPDTPITSETLWIGYSEQPALLLQSFARAMDCGRPNKTHPVLWDSWFIDYEDVTETAILKQLDALSLIPGVDTVIVSDGYQVIHQNGPGIGDWLETNFRFPHGLAWLARQIRKRGLRPGIWTAPFMVGESSQFFKYYPEAILRSQSSAGSLWRESWRGDRACYLDTTHHDSQSFIREIFDTLANKDHFDLFMVDFAYAAAAPGYRANASSTGAAALDSALETIRRSVGDRRYLLLSGAPTGAGGSCVDAVRSICDTGPAWSGRCGVAASLHSTMSRSFTGLNGPAAACPSVLPCVGNLSLAEMRLLASVAALSGGPLSLSGPIDKLDPEWIDILRQANPVMAYPAIPLDLFERTYPQVYGSPLFDGGTSWVIAVVNTEDVPRPRSVSLRGLPGFTGGAHVFDYWQQEYLGVARSRMDLGLLPPHSCRLLVLNPCLHQPQILCATGQIRQEFQPVVGQRESVTGPGTASYNMVRPGRNTLGLHFHLPEGVVPGAIATHNGTTQLSTDSKNRQLITLSVSFHNHCRVEITFKHKT